MSEDADVLQQHDGGNVQLKDRETGPADSGRKQEAGTLALLRSALADSSLPQILLAIGVVVAVLIVGALNRSEVASGFTALANAKTGWLALATGISLSLFFVGTVTQMGSMPTNPPIRRIFLVQVAASFVNHLLPAGTGGMAVNVRFLHKHGLGRGAAVGSVGLNSLAGLVTHIALLITAIAISPAMMVSVRRQFDWSSWGHSLASVSELAWLEIAGGVILFALAVLIVARAARATRAGVFVRRLVRRGRSMARRLVREVRALGAVIRQPSRAAALWLGSLCVPIIHGLILFTVLESIGVRIGVGTVVVTYVVVSSLTALVPSPGGVGALDVALPAVFAAVAGVPGPDAIAAVVGYRLLTVWLPLLPGAAVFTLLLRRRII